ncbi:putative peptidase S8 subtilisin kexin sedolisin [Rosellinia necatrix]|uniref:Putative peptidase S8 subtilisin kexin sedolisin n=1 Tax=Rosellinia necatrix TaxID=77044 RepID=A0A1W2TBE7_ROSNE|nr:putative peptidase S8 subtilisin kexin sedolisin [Rosellinia necatrix]
MLHPQIPQRINTMLEIPLTNNSFLAEPSYSPLSNMSIRPLERVPTDSLNHYTQQSAGSGNRAPDQSFKAITEKWRQSQRDKNFSREFDKHVESLHDEIVEEWKSAHERSVPETTKIAFEQRLDKLLGGDGVQDGIDDCVLWVILFIAADRQEPADLDAEIWIIATILRSRPYLALENVNMAPIIDKCPYSNAGVKARHFAWQNLKKNKSTPFHESAGSNNAKALDCFITGIEIYCQNVMKNPDSLRAYPDWLKLRRDDIPLEQLFLHIVRANLPFRNKTALALAADEEQGDGEALECLLSRIEDIVDANDNTFADVVETGNLKIVDRFLQHAKAHDLFAQSRHIINAIELVPSPQGEGYMQRLNIACNLIGIAKKHNPNYFDLAVAGAIIKKDLLTVWEAMALGVSDPPCCILHLAVWHKKTGFVTKILGEHPEFVTMKSTIPTFQNSNGLEMAQDSEGHYPLWYNNRYLENAESRAHARPKSSPLDKERADIRSEIITHTVRQVRRMKLLSDILADSGEPARELCFDLSHINFQLHRVSEFIQSLINHRENDELIQYEETLQYADFPVLDMNPDDRDEVQLNKSFSMERKEVFQILDWLHRRKGVKKIISLRAPDRLINPHDETRIAEKIDMFKVEVLDWRLLDMSISIFSTEVKDRLTELHLYSSGKRAVISHWLGSDGVPSLRNLKLLHIYVIKETSDVDSCKKTVKYIRRELKRMSDSNRLGGLEYNNISVEAQFWNPVHQMENLDEIAKRVAPKLSQFIESYRRLAYKRTSEKSVFRATKVAIIDNGILGISQSHEKLPDDGDNLRDKDLVDGVPIVRSSTTMRLDEENRANFLANKSVSARIRGGRSFVDENYKLSPWFFASNPHGTQMANLICAIDPLCELYVAKVHDGQYGMTAGRVARAIGWAIAEDVDVISMSFTIISKEEDSELKEALALAGQRGIAVLCSAHDEGTRVDHAWPASHQGDYMLVVAACDEYGRLLREMDATRYSCMLHGKNVAAGVIPFLEPNDRITGSSVATALAAGLSSLALACDRLVDPTEDIHKTNNRGRASSIKKRFGTMQSTSQSKYVLLDKFAGIDQKMRVGQETDAESILSDWSAGWQGPKIDDV